VRQLAELLVNSAPVSRTRLVRIDLELELPTGEHRERLLAALANLIRRRGFETFVSAPLLLPRSEYFPERWERSVSGARRLLRRLMHYAGLGELKVALSAWRERPVIPGQLPIPEGDGHTAAWFSGIHDGTCEFGLELDQLRKEDSLVATLGHEVAHAYREHHGLVILDRDLEEKLTDLTCVYLGFGVFNVNASHVVETGGVSASGERLLYERHSLGYLSPGELALLLAAQLVVRDDATEQREVRSELLPNHAALIAQGLREFSAADLRRRFAIPEPTAWPPRLGIAALPSLPDEEPSEPAHEAEPPAVPAGAVVFRVKGDRALPLSLLALGGSVGLGLAWGVGAFAFYGLCAVATAAGSFAGRLLRADECSGCRARLRAGDAECAGCGCVVAGEIAAHEERLEAEERYRALHRNDDSDTPTDAGGAAEEEDPLLVLFTAMLAAWGLSRGLLAEDADSAQQELAARVQRLEFDTQALNAAWLAGMRFTDEAMLFVTYYCTDPASPSTQDFDILSTANRFDDRPTNYQRYATIVDRRFAEWKSTRGAKSGVG
jgi:hypothetical protein